MLTDKVVLVTGSGRRVGAAIARRLHAAGARLVLHYRRSAVAADDLADALNARRPGSAVIAQADLLDVDALPGLVDAARDAFGGLDVLVNNASSFFPTPLGQIGLADWDDLVGSNFRAPLFLTQAAAHQLRQRRGAVINITDIHAERPLKNYPLYCAAKGALLTLTRALAIELAPNVRVNAVAPGPIAWPDDGQLASPEERLAIVEHTLLGREGAPDDIAAAVHYLLVDAGYVTGQVINVDGGRTAHL